MKRILLAATVLALVAGPLAQTAWPDADSSVDSRDTDGPFDIRVLAHGHDRPQLTHTLRTHRAWRWREARCFKQSSKCRAFFRLHFYRSRHSDEHRYIDVWRREGKTNAAMYRWKPDCFSRTGICVGASPEEVGKPEVDRPDNRSLRVSFPKRFLGDRAQDRYFWRAYVVFWRKSECDRDSSSTHVNGGGYWCWDYAPTPVGRR
jgi:hypothetical protein